MRQITYAGVALLLATALACSPRDRQETANTADAAAEDVGDAAREGAAEVREGAEEIGDEAREARDYAYAQRTDFRRDVDLRLERIDEQIKELEADTKRGVDETRDSALVRIRAARKAVSRDLEKLGSATESNWNDLKGDVNQSLYSLQEAVRRQLPDARPMGGTGPS
ncbi:MAG TPA: hypothetical protein VJ808_03925 [Gemmatimonadales bacterium]|nr:hypothetical protein [Gemmatimonadales bacterium]